MTANVAALTSRSDVCDAEEVQPLLAPRERKETPLPKAQLFTLCGIRLAEPIAHTQILAIYFIAARFSTHFIPDFPLGQQIRCSNAAIVQRNTYNNQMMEWLHVTDQPSRIGFYSGLVETSFAFAQLLCIFHWASLSGQSVGSRAALPDLRTSQTVSVANL